MSPDAAPAVDDYATCPRCEGTGYWPPSRMATAHHRQGDCDWCYGYGGLTRTVMGELLAAQKQRRLDMIRMSPVERKRLTKWDMMGE